MLFRSTGIQGAATANQTVSHSIAYFAQGANSQTFSTATNTGATNLNFQTSMLSSFSGYRAYDIPFNSSLSAGDYWMAIQKSTAVATNLATLTKFTNNQ
mgnify:CR=1 FL=1